MSAPPTTRPTGKASARRPAVDRHTAERLATTEYARVADLLDRLTPEQWAAPTDCPGWDVRAMAGHVLGMMQMVASKRELVRQQLTSTRHAKRDKGLMIDALTALQVRQNADLTTDDLVAEIRRLTPRAVKGRIRLPELLRRQAMNDEEDGWWTFAYLMDVILTRDPFMHRVDMSRAAGEPMKLTAEHDGVLVDDVAREWAGRHGAPFVLELTGPAGGRWQEGEGGEELSLDAVEFCRVLSGRAPGEGLLATRVPF